MKKINYILMLSTASLLHSASFAFVNNKNSCPQTVISCPQQITCAEEGNLKSCKPMGGKLEYWNTNGIINEGRVSKGTYSFSNTYADYLKPSDFGTHAACLYTLNSTGMTKRISLSIYRLVYIEPAIYRSNYWNVYGYQANCSHSNADACPFIEPGLFMNRYMPISASSGEIIRVSASANGNLIKNDAQNDPKNERPSLITYDEAFLACGGVQRCKIDINIAASGSNKSTYPIYTGSVVVDMMSDLHIVSISPNTCSGYTMKKEESFNTISFEKSNKASCSQ